MITSGMGDLLRICGLKQGRRRTVYSDPLSYHLEAHRFPDTCMNRIYAYLKFEQ
jgi:hypothetical protein